MAFTSLVRTFGLILKRFCLFENQHLLKKIRYFFYFSFFFAISWCINCGVDIFLVFLFLLYLSP